MNNKKKPQNKNIMEIMAEKQKYEAHARMTELKLRREQMKFDFKMRQRQMELEECRMRLQETQQLQDEKCDSESHEDCRIQQEFFMKILDFATTTKRN